jgi:RHS repeat-associated protein
MMVLRNDDGQQTVHLGKLYQHKLSDNTQTKHYLFGGKLVAMRINSTVSFFLTDHLGSVAATLYANGNLRSSLRYDPWGKLRWSQNVDPNGYRYTGQRWDDGLGLYDYNARYYLPYINRFISADTIVPNPANPQSFNRYSYVRNNPLKYKDPTGHYECHANGICADVITSTWTPTRPALPASQPLISFTGGTWSNAAQATIRQAAVALGQAMADAYNGLWSMMEANFTPLTADQAFRSVMGGTVEFNRSNAGCTTGCWGEATGRRTITVYTDAFNNNGQARFAGTFNGVQWAMHEMGHLFENRVNGILGRDHIRNTLGNHDDFQTLLSRGADNDMEAYGFAGTLFGWQQSPSTASGEIFADMVIGWTYGRWETRIDGSLTDSGAARAQFMNSNMPGWISLVVDQQ